VTIIIRRRQQGQPQRALDMASGIPAEVHATVPLGGSWYNARTRRATAATRTFFDVKTTPVGVSWEGNTAEKTIDLGVPSGNFYGALIRFNLTASDLTSAYVGGLTILKAAEDATSPGVGIGIGAQSGYFADETVTVASSDGYRSAMTGSIVIGPHTLCIQWNSSSAKYEIWLDGALPTQVHSTPAAGVWAFKPYFCGRQFSGNPRLSPSLIVINQSPSFDLRTVQANPWQLFAPRQIIIPSAAAAAGIYTLSNPTMYQLTSTTGYPRVDVTVT
jgi:hypothetical protein